MDSGKTFWPGRDDSSGVCNFSATELEELATATISISGSCDPMFLRSVSRARSSAGTRKGCTKPDAKR